jgi:hypothetical protein
MITRTQEAGFALGVQTEFLFATAERDIEPVLAGLGARAQALIIHPDVLFTSSREKLAALAIREKAVSNLFHAQSSAGWGPDELWL